MITTTATTHEPISDKLQKSSAQPSQKKRIDSQEGEIGYYELKDDDMELVELNSRMSTSNRQTHRELPVDVPESFVGMFTLTSTSLLHSLNE